MKILKLSLCAAAASLAMAGSAAAQVSFNAGVATDYIFRGIDQTGDDNGQVFAGADWANESGLYLGTWVSNSGPSSLDDGIEYDLYGGFKPQLGPVALDLGLIYYGYAYESDLNTLEVKAAASIPAGPATVGVAAYWSDDMLGTDAESLYVEANLAFTLEGGATVSGAVGRSDCECNGIFEDKYTTWNLGVTLPITEKVSFDARYIGTDGSDTISVVDPDTLEELYAGPEIFGAVGDRLVGTLKVVF